MEEVAALLRQVVTRLDKFEERLSSMERSGRRMDSHITFVESVYRRLRAPPGLRSGKIQPSD